MKPRNALAILSASVMVAPASALANPTTADHATVTGGDNDLIDIAGSGNDAIDIIGSGNDAIDVVGSGNDAIDVVGSGNDAIDVVGSGNDAIGVVGGGSSSIGWPYMPLPPQRVYPAGNDPWLTGITDEEADAQWIGGAHW